MQIKYLRIIFIVGGIGALIFAIFYTFHLIEFKENAILLDAEIIDCKEFSDNDCFPIVKFYLNSESPIIIELERSVDEVFGLQVGDSVQVYYNPSTEETRMSGLFSFWQPIFIGFPLSIFFIVLGIFLQKIWDRFGE